MPGLKSIHELGCCRFFHKLHAEFSNAGFFRPGPTCDGDVDDGVLAEKSGRFAVFRSRTIIT